MRAGVQDVARIDRQQRNRAAEQHREKIERDRAQNHGTRTHEAHTFGNAFDTRALEADSARRRPPKVTVRNAARRKQTATHR